MILAVCYFHGLSIERDPLKAVELWTEVIESGRIDCVLELGPIYEHWLSVDVDLLKAAELYKWLLDTHQTCGSDSSFKLTTGSV